MRARSASKGPCFGLTTHQPRLGTIAAPRDSHTSAWPCVSPRLAVRGKRSRGCTRRTWTTNPGKFMRSHAPGWELSAHGKPRSVSFRVSPAARNMTVLVLPALARAEDRHCVFVAASDDGALRIWTTASDKGRAQRTQAVLQVGTCSHALRIRPHWPDYDPTVTNRSAMLQGALRRLCSFFSRHVARAPVVNPRGTS